MTIGVMVSKTVIILITTDYFSDSVKKKQLGSQTIEMVTIQAFNKLFELAI
jgi:hypothetical protein